VKARPLTETLSKRAPAWAGFALGIVWGIANRNYPVDEQPGA
jgi:hypothetical protein